MNARIARQYTLRWISQHKRSYYKSPNVCFKMKKIFYTAEAYISAYAQGSDLILTRSKDDTIYGASFEFNTCTKDISKASIKNDEIFNKNDQKFESAEWTGLTKNLELLPASWLDIMNAGLSDFVLGYQVEGEITIHKF
ncbi:hypothetical protein ACXR0M_15130 [Pseudomonas sp. Eth.TT006]